MTASKTRTSTAFFTLSLDNLQELIFSTMLMANPIIFCKRKKKGVYHMPEGVMISILNSLTSDLHRIQWIRKSGLQITSLEGSIWRSGSMNISTFLWYTVLSFMMRWTNGKLMHHQYIYFFSYIITWAN